MNSLFTYVTIEPVVLLYVVAIFAEYAVVEDLVYVSKCVNYLNMNNTDQLHICTEDFKQHHFNETVWSLVTTETNNAMLIYNGILYITSIISSFAAATYADRQTKFFPILIPLIGSGIVQVVILSVLTIESSGLPLIFTHSGLAAIFVCSFLSGISGGTSTLISSCFAHVAENSSKSERTSRITIVEACLFGGGFLGFTYAGAILRNHPNSLSRYYYNFGVYLLIHICLAIYVAIRRGIFNRPELIESQPHSSCGTLLTSVLRTVFRKRIHRHQRKIILLILVAFILISYWNVAITTILFIYTRNLLNWPTWKYSYFSSAKFGLCGISLCLMPLMQYLLAKRFSLTPLSDHTIILTGLLSRGASIMLIGLATITGDFMYVALLAIIFAEYPIPAIRSLVSKVVKPNEKTQLLVFLSTIQSICFFTGGMIFPAIYNSIKDKSNAQIEQIGVFNGPGLIFLVIGLMQFFSLFIFRYIKKVLASCNWNLQLNVDSVESERNNID